MLSRSHNCFSRVLLDSLACLIVCSMTGTHVLLQISGLDSGTPLDLVLSLVALTIPKQMVKLRDNIKCWSKLLDIYWQSSPCLIQSGVTCCIILSLLSTQQWQRALGALYLSWYMGNRLHCLLMSLWETKVGCLMQLFLLNTSNN